MLAPGADFLTLRVQRSHPFKPTNEEDEDNEVYNLTETKTLNMWSLENVRKNDVNRLKED